MWPYLVARACARLAPSIHRRGDVALDRLAVITKIITERPLCADCVMREAGIGTDELRGDLTRMSKWFIVFQTADRCRDCFRLATVFSLTPR
jgi:hypothetical protein